jgi:hypothetical protein
MLASRSVPLPLQPVVTAATNDIARRSSKPAPAPRSSKKPSTHVEESPQEDDGPLIF